jgi:Fur family ferric uptake transcriptional regulator
MSESLQKALESRGYRLTTARRVILDTLVESGGHLTADEVAERARQRATGLGRMTVYRTLDLLCDLGLLRPVYQGTGAAHYILMQDGHHHHLVCTTCSRVIEFGECGFDEMHRRVAERFGFRVDGHLLELYGVCEACRTTTNHQTGDSD